MIVEKWDRNTEKHLVFCVLSNILAIFEPVVGDFYEHYSSQGLFDSFVSPLKSEFHNKRKGISMDIFDLLSNKAYGQYIILAGAIVLFILYMIGRMVYFALFPSKRPWRTKSFEDEAEEYRNKPFSDSESIGSISMRLGEDVRDVWEMGYSDEQVNDVLTGKFTLEQMYKMEPVGNTKSSKGKEILEKKEQSM